MTLVERGTVYFVGVGPGDPELMTIRAKRVIDQADLILYAGSLVGEEGFKEVKPTARLVDSAGLHLAQIVDLMREAAESGQVVARVHDGDPALFGAIAEQIALLEAAGIPCEIIPGVSAVFAAAAALKAELTIPELSQTVILTRMAGRTPVPQLERLRDLASHQCTLAVYLSVGLIEKVVAELLTAYPPDTPVVVVQRVSCPDQRIVRGTLHDIAGQVKAAGMHARAVILVGPVFREGLRQYWATQSKLYDPTFTHAFRRGESASGCCPTRPSGEGSMSLAVITVTRQGIALGQQILDREPDALLYAPEQYAHSTGIGQGLSPSGRIRLFSGDLTRLLTEIYPQYHGLVFVMATGIVVRLIAEFIKDKRIDPAVVAMDIAGRFAISLLSGHLGGGNALAQRMAAITGATAVVTTGTDVIGTIAPDLIATEIGGEVDDFEAMKHVSAALVNGEPTGVLDLSGTDPLSLRGPLRPNVKRVDTLEALAASPASAAIIITNRLLDCEATLPEKAVVILRPKNLVVGLGCNRGTSADEITQAIKGALADHGLSIKSVECLATVKTKQDEAGLQEAAERLRLPLQFCTKEDLNRVAHVPNRSEASMQYIGVQGVAEPSALYISSGRLVVEKVKSGNVTVAVAEIQGAGYRD